MPRFLVKAAISSDKEYAPGDVIELSQAQADEMPWAVEPLPPEAEKTAPKSRK
jgi:hypothetical protein